MLYGIHQELSHIMGIVDVTTRLFFAQLEIVSGLEEP
jgi:hypothetical protein